jgi:tetratricopeptide (TPR) repeat protein
MRQSFPAPTRVLHALAFGRSHRALSVTCVLAATVSAAHAVAQTSPTPPPTAPQTSADGYTRYELQAPGSAAFRILYDITATTAGARRYYNAIRAGARETVHNVSDAHTGAALRWRVVDGAGARAGEHPQAGLDAHYIEVELPRAIPPGGGVRVRIDKTYVDSASYFTDSTGIVFRRSLSVPRNSVVLPAGYELSSVNVPSQIDTESDGRIRVSFMNPNDQALEYTVRARRLPPGAAESLARAAATPRAQNTPARPSGTRFGYDGSWARADRTFGERAAETRDIVYFLEQPESHAFRLYHDYTESRPGVDRYVNVVRAGSRVVDPWAFLLDTGEELRTETLRGAAVTARGIVAREQVDTATEVVLITFPAVRAGTSARLRIHETYIDPARYLRASDELVWDREFGRARNTVVLPQGWFLTASDMPASVTEREDGRIALTFWNPRPDVLQVFVRARPRAESVATSLTGERLFARTHPDEAALARAEAALRAAPRDVARLVDLGRELDRAFRYDRAIELYTQALETAPDDWRPWRFRGHRLLSTRRFTEGAADLERARQLAPYNFDVAYHLGLAYYLLGRFDDAATEYLRCIALATDARALAQRSSSALAQQRTCMSIADTDDTRVAVTEWAYRALVRAGRAPEARRLLDGIRPKMNVSANAAYHQALLSRRAQWPAADLLNPTPASGRFETRAYGPSLDALLAGNADHARFLLRRIAEDAHWPGFGRIAAEADLARLAR